MEQFDAFISYSHAADGRLAPAVQSGLQRLAKSVFQRRALRVFRDETGLSTNPHLWGSIETALDASDWFVLLASPESAASEWVNREIATWIERKPIDHLLIVVTDGHLAFLPDAGVDPAVTTCLPTSLVDALESEPRWLDLRWARDDTQLDLRNGRFRAAIADLAAPIHGMAKDDLEGDDVKQQKRAKRLAITGVAAVALLAVVSIIGALIAVDQRQSADSQRRRAETESQRAEDQAARADTAAREATDQAARADQAAEDATTQAARADAEANRATAKGLAAQAVATSSSDLGLSLLLATEGYRRDPSLDTEAGLLAALDSGRLVTSLKTSLPDDVVDVESTSDRSVLFVMTLSGDLWAYDTATLTPIGEPLVTDIVEPWALDLSRDGSRLAFSGGDGAGVVDTTTGAVIVDSLGATGVPALSPDGSRLAVGQLDTLMVFDVATGATQSEIDVQNASLAFLSSTRLAVHPLGSTSLTVYMIDADGAATEESTVDDLPQGGGMELSPDASTIITGGLRGTAVLLDAETLATKGAPIRVRGSRTGDFAFNADGTLVALGSDDGSVSVVDAATGDEVTALDGLTGTLVTDFIGDETLVSSSVSDGGATVWSLTSAGTALSTSQETGANVLVLRVVDGGDTIVASEGGDLIVAPRDDVAHPLVQRTFGSLIRAADVSEASGLVAVYAITVDETGTRVDRAIHLVGLDDLADRTVITLDDPIENIALSPDGSLLAVGRRDGRLQVNDVTSGEVVLQPVDVDEFPCCLGTLVWSSDGTRLHTGGQDGFLRTFDTSTWEQVGEQQLTTGQIALRLSQLSDDGATIIVPAESGEIFLVDEATGEVVGEPFISSGTQIQRAVLVRDGTMLAAQSRDGKLRLWDVSTHRLVGSPLIGHSDESDSVERISDRVLLTGGAADGQIIEWSLDPDTWVQRACALAGRNLTHDEWNAYIGGEYAITCDQWPAGE